MPYRVGYVIVDSCVECDIRGSNDCAYKQSDFLGRHTRYHVVW